MALTIASLLGLYALVQYQIGLDAGAALYWSDGFWTLAALASGWRSLQAARRATHPGDARAWTYFAAAHFAWAGGMLVWDYYELVRGTETPFPSIADAGYIGLALLFVMGSLHYRSAGGGRITIKHGLNIAIALVAVTVMTVLALHQSIHATTESAAYIAVALAYPILYGSALMFAIGWLWVAVKGRRRYIYALLVGGLTVHTGVNVVYAAYLLVRDYHTGAPLDVFWLIGFGLFYAAANEACLKAEEAERPAAGAEAAAAFDSPTEAMVPSLAFLFVIGVSFVYRDTLFSDGPMDSDLMAFLFVMAAVFAALLVGREFQIYHFQRRTLLSLARSTARRRHAEEQLRDAIENIMEGFALFDADGRLVTCNGRYKEFYGYSDEDVRPGVHTRELGRLDLARGTVVLSGSAEEYLGRRDSHGRAFSDKYTIKLGNGRVLETSDSWTASGGIVSIQGDVTDYRRAQQDMQASHDGLEERVRERTAELYESVAKAEAANRVKSELLANMSHELRTPLNAIIGFSGAMQARIFGPLGNDKYQDYTDNILHSGEHLLELIDDILDVSVIEAGKLQLLEERLDVGKIIEAVLILVRPRANAAGIRIDSETTAPLPGLLADGRRLKQILLNLLTNAIKFSPAGGRVAIDVRRDVDEALIFEVADDGIGMDTGEIAMALEPFGRVNAKVAKNVEGTGLGLPLTIGLVEAHGGTLEIESAPNQGTRVSVRFPMGRVVA